MSIESGSPLDRDDVQALQDSARRQHLDVGVDSSPIAAAALARDAIVAAGEKTADVVRRVGDGAVEVTMGAVAGIAERVSDRVAIPEDKVLEEGTQLLPIPDESASKSPPEEHDLYLNE